jgi:hypothetical protein
LSIGDGLALGRAARYISAASRHPVPMGAQQRRAGLMARQFFTPRPSHCSSRHFPAMPT